MQKFFVLLQKELVENWKTWKIVLVFAVCIALGLIIPFITDGSYIGDPLVNPLQSRFIVYNYTYYLSMGLAMLVPFVLMSTVAREVKDGLAAAILVKPVGRGAYILSKFLVAFTIFALAITASLFICYYYALEVTKLYDPDPVTMELLMKMLGFILLYVAFALSMTLFISTMTRNNVVAGAIAMTLLVALFGFSFEDNVRQYLPSEVIRWGQELVFPSPRVFSRLDNPYWVALWGNIGGILLFISSAILIIKNKEI